MYLSHRFNVWRRESLRNMQSSIRLAVSLFSVYRICSQWRHHPCPPCACPNVGFWLSNRLAQAVSTLLSPCALSEALMSLTDGWFDICPHVWLVTANWLMYHERCSYLLHKRYRKVANEIDTLALWINQCTAWYGGNIWVRNALVDICPCRVFSS